MDGRSGAFWTAALVLALVSAACGRTEKAPPVDPQIEALKATGRALFFARAGCTTCHRLGSEGVQIVGPNLGIGDGQIEPVGLRVRHDGLWGMEYVVESIVDPDAYTVPGYARGVMKRYEEPPIALTDDEIIAVAAFVASSGDGVAVIDREAVARARQRIDTTRRAREMRLAGAGSQ